MEKGKIREEWVDLLAREFARVRTGGNVFMDGRHNPLPSERQAARRFMEDFLYAMKKDSEVDDE